MFLKVHVKNFKSLIDFEFDLTEKKNHCKELALVYGENGSGKTNIVSIFHVLTGTLQTMSAKEILENLLDKESDDLPPEKILRMIRSKIPNIENIIKQSKTFGTTENLYLKFDFLIDKKNGSYTLEFNKKEIVYEKLEYLVEKKKATFFEMCSSESTINPKLFNSNEYANEIASKVEKFWGKHTLMSILLAEFMEKNTEYTTQNINPNFHTVMDAFVDIYCYSNSPLQITSASKSLPLDGDFSEGIIKNENISKLSDVAEILTFIFSNLYSDIKQLFYKTKKHESDYIEYELYLKKIIGGKIREIPFEIESSGTKNILSLLPPLFLAIQGQTVILDEFDTGIHDILIWELFEKLNETIKGQLIVTTHNTLLLETDIENKYLYILIIDQDGNKRINSLDKYELRVHQNHNRRSQYLKGLYYGVPFVGNLDFELVADQLSKIGVSSE